MEDKKLRGLYRLFVILFFFVASIFFLNSQKSKSVLVTHVDMSDSYSQLILSVDQAYYHISSLLSSRNTDLIVKFINQSMGNRSVDLVEKIIAERNDLLSQEEKMDVLFGVVLHCGGKKAIYYKLFDLLLVYHDLHKNHSVLLTLFKSSYHDCLPFFINWVRDRQKEDENNDLWNRFIDHAVVVAIEHNDSAAIESMLSKKIKISSAKASLALWKVVECNKNKSFISLLVKYCQADINDVRSGKTLLIEAVEQKNREIIQTLLEEGAVVDRIVDPLRGTALQVAIAGNDVDIQALLREYGA